MYLYDPIDQRLVDERVAQFRDQTRRFLAGELVGGRVPGAAPAKRALHPALCADAAHRHPLRPALHAPAAQARGYRAPLRPRRRAFFDPAELAAQLAAPGGGARDPGRARHGADARHPDLRQLHSQHHHRPLRRGRARRDRRLLRVVRAHPPVVHLPSRVQLSAAQVQDRGQRRGGRPRGNVRARHRPACAEERERRSRLSRRRRRRPRPHADDRPGHAGVPALASSPHLSRGDPAGLQPARQARQHPQGAHQDPAEGARRRAFPRRSGGRVDTSERRRRHRDAGRCSAYRSALHAAAIRAARARPADRRARPGSPRG